jgi:transcriptional regulator of acetoin/glycerol metabolism
MDVHRLERDAALNLLPAELSQLTEALRSYNGSVVRAAAAVGISRQRAYRLMEAGGVVGAGTDESDDLSQGQGEAQ